MYNFVNVNFWCAGKPAYNLL